MSYATIFATLDSEVLNFSEHYFPDTGINYSVVFETGEGWELFLGYESEDGDFRKEESLLVCETKADALQAQGDVSASFPHINEYINTI